MWPTTGDDPDLDSLILRLHEETACRRGGALNLRPILTWVERNFGYAVARAYAGHNDRGNDVGSTATYVRADLQEVAAALAALTGKPHPLAA